MAGRRRVFKFEVIGHKELQKTLEALPKSIQDQVLKECLKRALAPTASLARTLAPKDEGELAASIVVSSRLKKGQRERLHKGVVAMYVGPSYSKVSSNYAPHGHLVEFGTGARFHKSGKYVGIMRPKPFLRPAWDATKAQALKIVREEMWAALRDAVRRLRKRSDAGKLSASQTRAFIR